eukprot:CAMPEP_0169195472 /NCGR_PEP_ID=MMETSP1016-20121227/7231_1 /TAXON_ID=342587 /ORGANISM="Karlodinium micrum, Strain CCMP2283" /LENGTH=530 /DNA_ID=CAMNT_0009272011 /DNA_START=114 /DNA_END=1703 /DNA_ORIENTATION=-
MDQSNFEEHASELPYLCQLFQTSIDEGLSNSVLAERLSTAEASRAGPRTETKPRKCCGFLCSSEFPPQQSWWLEAKQKLVPTFEVVRGGKLTSSAATDLVLGDIVYICAGQQVAVDGRILVAADGTAVDASHLTSRSNDVRICSTKTTAGSALESRNIVLKDSHIISGALFCMVVRTTREPFIPASAQAAEEDQASAATAIDVTLPASLSLGECQSIFKQLCVKANLFCKAFKVIEAIGTSRYAVVILTQDLLDRGNLLAFCKIMANLKKTVIFVMCNCSDEEVEKFCQSLSVQRIDFEDPGMLAPPGSREKSSYDEETTEIDGTSSFDLSLCISPMGMERVGEFERSKLAVLWEQLKTEGRTSAVVSGISQAALLKLCKQLGDSESPLLYVMTDFHYSKCFRSLAVDTVRNQRINPSALGTSELSTGVAGSSYAASPMQNGSASEHFKELSKASLGAPQNSTATRSMHYSDSDCSELPSASKHIGSMVSTRTDPAPHFNVRSTPSGPAAQRSGQVFVSVNSIGIVSAHS